MDILIILVVMFNAMFMYYWGLRSGREEIEDILKYGRIVINTKTINSSSYKIEEKLE